jgi:YD repeat-containing protein
LALLLLSFCLVWQPSSLRAQCTACGGSDSGINIDISGAIDDADPYESELSKINISFAGAVVPWLEWVNAMATPQELTVMPQAGNGGTPALSQTVTLPRDGTGVLTWMSNCPGYYPSFANAHIQLAMPKGVDLILTNQTTGAQVAVGAPTPCSTCQKNYFFTCSSANQAGQNGYSSIPQGVYTISYREKTPVGAGENSNCDDSVHSRFGLGVIPGGLAAGSINLDQTSLGPTSYEPVSLTCNAPTSVQTVPANLAPGTALRQVNAPQCFADILPLAGNPSYGYTISFYTPSQVGAQAQGTGIYALSGSPFVTYTVQNPDASPTVNNRLAVTETRGGLSTVSMYTYTASSETWSLSTGGSSINGPFPRVESKTEVDSNTGGTNPVPVSQFTRTINNGTTPDTSSITHIINSYAWGAAEVQTIVGENADAQITTHTFDNITGSPTWSQLTQIGYPDGHTELYPTGATGESIGPVMDTPPVNAAAGWVVGASPTPPQGWTSTTLDSVNGQTVRQSNVQSTPMATSPLSSGTMDIETTADYTNASNSLTTTTVTYNSDCPFPWTSQPYYTLYPDGRQDSWTYEAGTFLAAPNDGSFHDSASGTACRQTLTHGTAASPVNGSAPVAVPGLSTQERSTYDEQGRLVIEETLAYPSGGSGYVVVSTTTHSYDVANHLTGSVQNGITIYSAVWGANGQKTSETDAQGVVTSYSNYDGLGRALTVTKGAAAASGSYAAQAAIPTALTLDPVGNTLGQTVGGHRRTPAGPDLDLQHGRVADEPDDQWSDHHLLVRQWYQNAAQRRHRGHGPLHGWAHKNH